MIYGSLVLRVDQKVDVYPFGHDLIKTAEGIITAVAPFSGSVYYYVTRRDGNAYYYDASQLKAVDDYTTTNNK